MKKFKALGLLLGAGFLVIGTGIGVTGVLNTDENVLPAEATLGDPIKINNTDYVVVYETGFETDDDGKVTTATSYKSVKHVYIGEYKWTVDTGNITGTDKTSGDACLHARSYSSYNEPVFIEANKTGTTGVSIDAIQFSYKYSKKPDSSWNLSAVVDGGTNLTIGNLATLSTNNRFTYTFENTVTLDSLKILQDTAGSDARLSIDDVIFLKKAELGPAAESIIIETDLTSFYELGEFTLAAKVLPEGAIQNVTWSVSPVAAENLLPGETAGEATITGNTLKASKAGVINLTATANGTTVTKTEKVTIKPNSFVELLVEGTPVKQHINSDFDPSGLTFKAKYEYGNTVVLDPSVITFEPNYIATLEDTIVIAEYNNDLKEITGYEIDTTQKSRKTSSDYDLPTDQAVNSFTENGVYVLTHTSSQGFTINTTYSTISVYADHKFNLAMENGNKLASLTLAADENNYKITTSKISVSNGVAAANNGNGESRVVITPNEGVNSLDILFSDSARLKYIEVLYEPVQFGEITSVKVTKEPTKTVYFVGESLDLTGLELIATDGTNSKAINIQDPLLTFDFENGYQFLGKDICENVDFGILYGELLVEPTFKYTVKTDGSTPYELLTADNIGQLAYGDKIVITNADATYAAGLTNGETYLEGVQLTAAQNGTAGTLNLKDSEVNISRFTLLPGHTGTGYSLVNGEGYLAKSGNNITARNDIVDTAEWTIEFDAQGGFDVKLTNISYVGDNYGYLRFNNGANPKRFKTYKNEGQGDIAAYVLKGDDAAAVDAYSQYLLDRTATDCKALTVTSETWTALEAGYNKLTAAQKELFKAVRKLTNTEETTILSEKAAQRYDYIVRIYGLKDFANRGIQPNQSSIMNLGDNNMITIIIVISVLSVSGIALLAISKRKKITR